jgi:hypothetical protein
MARLVALNALFFAVPFAAYAAWLLATRGSLRGAGAWPLRIVLYLCLAGALLMAIGLIALTSFSGSGPTDTYRPAVLRDGQIVPGEFEHPN